MGRKNVFLRPGEYTYTITYRTDQQLGFFKEFDELYWNVTGNGWTFAIDRAEAVLELPAGAEILKKAAYTGYFGAKGGHYTTSTDSDGNIRFATTRPLRPKEGLTIAVAWPKGIVKEPSFQERMGRTLRANASMVAAFIGLLALLVYYLAAWYLVGKDPAQGTVIPRFFPPKGFSPAATRFVRRMGFDHKAFASAVVNLAVRGALQIDEDEDSGFTLKKKGEGDTQLSKGEQKVLKRLFRYGERIELENKNHKKIQGALSALKKSLKTEFEKAYFVRNSNYFLPGAGLTLATLIGTVLTAEDLGIAVFMSFWLSMWTIGCYFLVTKVFGAWKGVLTSGGLKALRGAGALGMSLFALPFLAGEVVGLFFFSHAVSALAALVLLVAVVINAVFYHLLKAPTLAGRKIMDEIEGFKRYLSVAEKERLEVLNPPEKTPELFERYLPYAMALDVENRWSEQFSDVVAAAGEGDAGYRPVWYSGRHFSSSNLSGFSSALGSSFAGAISSASTAPGSGSGSGGGGSSGGGGGGGGGSGW
jgi:hypothetical protein